MKEDAVYTCKTCWGQFVFTAGEQEFFESKGWRHPVRCPRCRKLKKERYEQESKYFGLRSTMYPSDCCKRDAKGKPVYLNGGEGIYIDHSLLLEPGFDCGWLGVKTVYSEYDL